MSRNESKPIDRCSEILLALIKGAPQNRLSEQEQQLRREEVNQLLSRMDDHTIVDTLNMLYRIAERDAQRRAHSLAAAITESHSSRWFSAFRRRRS